MKLIPALLLSFLLCTPALAQSGGGFTAGQTLTAAQLNAALMAKLDYSSSPIPVTSGGTGSISFTPNKPLIGTGTSGIQTGTTSGNTTIFGTTSGSLISQHCVKFDVSGNLVDAGAGCATLGANTFTGKQLFPASATGGAGINLGAGVAPTSPNNGDCWATSTGLFCFNGGVTQQYLVSGNNLSDINNAATAKTNLGLANIASSGSASDITSGTLVVARGGTGAGTFTANKPLIGAGTGAVTTGTTSGSTTTFATASGTLTSGHCVQIDASGNFIDAGGVCTTGGGGGTVTSGLINQLGYYASAGTVISGLTTANSGVLVTSAGGVPSISTTLPGSLSIPSPTVTGAFTATGLVTNADLANSSTTVLGTSCTLGSSCTPTVALASNVSGTLPVANGGTGAATLSGGKPLFGAGTSAITTGTLSGNTTELGTVTGALTSGHCIQADVSGNLVDAGSGCGGSGSGTVNSGTSNQISYYATSGTAVSGITTANNAVLVTNGSGVPSESTTLPSSLSIPSPTVTGAFTATGLVTNADLVNSGTTVLGTVCSLGSSCTPTVALASNVSGTLPVANGGTGAATLASGKPVLGNGTSAVTTGTTSGNTTVFGTTSGTLTAGDCVQIDSSHNLVDAGGVCTTGGGGGTVTSGAINNIAYYASAGTAVVGLATTNNGVLVTSGSGVPSVSTTLPTGMSIPFPALSASTTGAAALNVPQGVTPTSPNNGDIWTTSSGLFARLAGTTDQFLIAGNNLSELTNQSTAQTNLGLGTAAVKNTGTSGANVPLMNGGNTWSGAQTFSAEVFTSASATGNAGINIAEGVAPTSPSDGDIWTTTGGLFAQTGGSTNQVAYTTSNISGKAATATALATARTISLTGSAVASTCPTFNGTANINCSTSFVSQGDHVILGNISGGTAVPGYYDINTYCGLTSETFACGNDSRFPASPPLLQSNNLSDLGSATTARSNLGLGGAAVLSVGQTTGTVAAGDDSRFKGPTQDSRSVSWTFILLDAGEQVYHPSADTTARTWTIPANSSVAYAIGTKIELVNDCGAGTITLNITTDTLEWFPTGSTGSRTLASCGIAELTKITSTSWAITGTGLT